MASLPARITEGAKQLLDPTILAAQQAINALIAFLTQEAWTAPTLGNAWVNFGGTSTNAGYMKDSLGFVHLRGTIKNGTIGLAAFTLPVGYRPSADVRFPATSAGAYGQYDISPAGVVVPSVGVNTSSSMDGITFDTR